MLLLLLSSFPALLLAQCPTAICDSFDSYTGSLVNNRYYGPSNLSASVSTSTSSPITADIDTTFFNSPPSSLHITCTASNSTNALLNSNPNPAWTNIYGRAMVYYSNSSGNRIPTSVHSWIFSANGMNSYYSTHNGTNMTQPNGAVSMNIIVGGGGNKVLLNYHWGPSEASASSTQTIQANQWFCLQWHYDGPNSGAKVWVDGNLYINVTHNNSFTGYTPTSASQWRFADMPGWTKMQFGFQHYQTLAAPVDLHLDDFQLDSSMTCCPCAAGVTLPYCCSSSAAPSVASPTPQPTSNTTTANGAGKVQTAGAFLALSLLFSVL